MEGFYYVRVNLERFPHNYGDIVLFSSFGRIFRPSLPQFRALPPIKNYIFGISRNRAVSSESFGVIL